MSSCEEDIFNKYAELLVPLLSKCQIIVECSKVDDDLKRALATLRGLGFEKPFYEIIRKQNPMIVLFKFEKEDMGIVLASFVEVGFTNMKAIHSS